MSFYVVLNMRCRIILIGRLRSILCNDFWLIVVSMIMTNIVIVVTMLYSVRVLLNSLSISGSIELMMRRW